MSALDILAAAASKYMDSSPWLFWWLAWWVFLFAFGTLVAITASSSKLVIALINNIRFVLRGYPTGKLQVSDDFPAEPHHGQPHMRDKKLYVWDKNVGGWRIAAPIPFGNPGNGLGLSNQMPDELSQVQATQAFFMELAQDNRSCARFLQASGILDERGRLTQVPSV